MCFGFSDENIERENLNSEKFRSLNAGLGFSNSEVPEDDPIEFPL